MTVQSSIFLCLLVCNLKELHCFERRYPRRFSPQVEDLLHLQVGRVDLVLFVVVKAAFLVIFLVSGSYDDRVVGLVVLLERTAFFFLIKTCW